MLPGESLGNFCPNRSATFAIVSPFSTTAHSPEPCTPRVWLRSSAYSSTAKDTTGFCSRWRAVVVPGFVQKYSVGPSFTYRNVLACGTPLGVAVASVSVFCSER